MTQNTINPSLLAIAIAIALFTSPLLLLIGADQTIDVVRLGARSDGQEDATNAFLAAWSGACASASPAAIYVPPGRYALREAVFWGPCTNTNITVRIDGALVAPSDYNVIGKSESWIKFKHVDGVVTVSGGVLDGQGSGLWACKASGSHCPDGATNLRFSNSNNIVVNGVTSVNSQKYHIVFDGCNNVNVNGVNVFASGDSPNTDGIHVESSSGVTILNSTIATGDDCVSVGKGTTNLWIEQVACGPGHGISIGSLGKELKEDGVYNVTVKNVTFTGTTNGLRIKTWGRPSSGFASDIHFEHAIMNNVENPILIDQQYCPNHRGCPGHVSGVKVSNVTYQDVRGTSANKVAVKFDCSAKNRCTGIRLENVKLTYENSTVKEYISHAQVTTV